MTCTICRANTAPTDVDPLAPNDGRALDSLAGRRAARAAIAAHAGIPSEDIRIERRAGAAPLCTVRRPLGHWAPLLLSLSISHCDNVGLAAAADAGVRIGADLERTGSVDPEQERYFLAPNERRAAPPVDATLLWVLKEAAWKALDLDTTLPFTAVQLDFAPGTEELRGIRVGDCTHAARARVMRFTVRGHHFVAAVVQIGGEAR